MKILLISTLSHNPGDEFIRLGVEKVMRQVFPDSTMRVIHKHDPRTLFSGFRQRDKTPRRLVSPWLYRFYAALWGRREENYLETSDLIVFAGTPFIWRSSVRTLRFTSENAEWVPAIWRRLFKDFPRKPVLNLSAGTSVTDAQQVEALLADPVVSGFLKQALNRAQLTTSRDDQTREILGRLGFDVPIIPCASIMAAKGAFLEPQAAEYVAVNLMRSAAHSWRGQRGDSKHWRPAIQAVVDDIAKRHKILFVSHSADEDRVAAEWFPQHPRIFSKEPIVLLKAYGKALYGVCNRVHAAAAIASFGRPAIVIGGDSRINLIQQFGLPAFDHRHVDAVVLLKAVNDLEAAYSQMTANLERKIVSVELEYTELIQSLALEQASARSASPKRAGKHAMQSAEEAA